eukprot:m.222395 g.222395  ORF g.222395 m.222395 type:complete len:334 (-) comp10753_c0_seq1:170-1171(-)
MCWSDRTHPAVSSPACTPEASFAEVASCLRCKCVPMHFCGQNPSWLASCVLGPSLQFFALCMAAGGSDLSTFPDNIFTPNTARAFFADPIPLIDGAESPAASNPRAPTAAASSSAPPASDAPAPAARATRAAAMPTTVATLAAEGIVPTRRKLEFDAEKLTVDDLREELRLRGLATSGSKAVLLERLEEAVATRNDIALNRLANVKKRKRNNNKREPLREDFDSDEAYQEAWAKWRDTRDNNNESVKRSREHARQRKFDHEQLCQEREQENKLLVEEVQLLRQQVSCLSKVLQQPEALTADEQMVVRNLLDPVAGLAGALDPVPGTSDGTLAM